MAWFAFVGSTNTDDGTRFGCAVVSIRVNVMLPIGAFASCVTNTRPPCEATHIGPAPRPRETQARVPPTLPAPNAAPVSGADIAFQWAAEPQAPVKSRSLVPNSPAAVLQCCSRNV